MIKIVIVMFLAVLGMSTAVYVMNQATLPETVISVGRTGVLEEVEVPNERFTGKATLGSLFELGKTLECSFRREDRATLTEGTAFFNNGDLRVDTMSMYEGKANGTTSSLIMSDEMMYVWGSTGVGSFAIKLPVSAMPAPTRAAQDGRVSLQENVAYECKPWNVDGSVFAPPANITFMDMNTVMKTVPGAIIQS